MSNNINKNNGKVAVVTGSSRGIGKAIANQFVKSGYCVALDISKDAENRKQSNGLKHSRRYIKRKHLYILN